MLAPFFQVLVMLPGLTHERFRPVLINDLRQCSETQHNVGNAPGQGHSTCCMKVAEPIRSYMDKLPPRLSAHDAIHEAASQLARAAACLP